METVETAGTSGDSRDHRDYAEESGGDCRDHAVETAETSWWTAETGTWRLVETGETSGDRRD